MKTKKVKRKQESWAVPGEFISLEAFKVGIKKAEKGSFTTLEEVKKGVEEWKERQKM